MTAIQIASLRKQWSPRFSLTIDELAVRDGEFVSIVGNSMSGKSTLLSLIGGFVAPDEGTITVLGRPASRNFGAARSVRTLFQDLGLYPHLSVVEQLELGLIAVERDRHKRRGIIEEWLTLLRLETHRNERPARLSGGAKQRLALGRALISHPRLLLLDEPLTAVDPGLRSRMWDDLRRYSKSEATTHLVVTHDPDLALSESDRILVLDEGRCIQFGTPSDVYTNPASEVAARLLGPTNLLKRGRAHVLIRPDTIFLGDPPPGDVQSLEGRLRKISFFGDAQAAMVDVGDDIIIVRLTSASAAKWNVGENVTVWWYSEDARLIA